MREPYVILTDHTVWKSWFQQLKTRCVSLRVWEQISPKSNVNPKIEPIYPVEPDIGLYERRTTPGLEESGNEIIPTTASELSESGLKAWKDDIEYYKLRLEAFKHADKKYQEEKASLDKVLVFVLQTVSTHLMNFCEPRQSIRTWLNTLKDPVGIDAEEERECARDRYLTALKPMGQAGDWNTWLSEYDHAATIAETEVVAEVQNIHDVMRDFLRSIMKVAPTWEVIFKEHGRREKNMTRRTMMKRFREHMRDHCDVKERQRRGAFATSDASFLAAVVASTPGTDSDASHAADSVSSTPATQRSRGRPRNKRNIGQVTTSKRSSKGDTVATGGANCPAYKQRHGLENCYYVHKEKVPKCFVPRSGIAVMVEYRLEHDTDLQEKLKAEKRSCTKTTKNKITQGSEGSNDWSEGRYITTVTAAVFLTEFSHYPLRRSFILDSGSTIHITNDRDQLRNLRHTITADYVWAGNTKVWIRGYGSVVLNLVGPNGSTKLELSNVALCPDTLCNLVSFRLLRRQGMWLNTKSNSAAVKRQDDTTVANLKEAHGQWILEHQDSNEASFYTGSTNTNQATTKQRP